MYTFNTSELNKWLQKFSIVWTHYAHTDSTSAGHLRIAAQEFTLKVPPVETKPQFGKNFKVLRKSYMLLQLCYVKKEKMY